jgi:hypothetical protein
MKIYFKSINRNQQNRKKYRGLRLHDSKLLEKPSGFSNNFEVFEKKDSLLDAKTIKLLLLFNF